MDIEKEILLPIDMALEENRQHVREDAALRIEEEVWLQIEDGVGRDYDMDEAIRRFTAWRNTYVLGKLATK